MLINEWCISFTVVILRSSTALGVESLVEFFFVNRDFPVGKLELVNGSRPIKFLIHGWGESSERPYYSDFTGEYLKQANYDIVQVDWKVDASLPYVAAAAKTKDVGEHIAKRILSLLDGMREAPAEFLANIHLIGHSLGAHVAGHAGRAVFQRSGYKLGRITGLDPAGPHFNVLPMARLANSDANFVDVTHTDSNFLGLAMPIGDVDFYPNGGTRPQPACELFNPISYKMDPVQFASCSHIRSYQFFIDSINKPPILAFRCDSYSNFKKNFCANNEQVIYGEFVNHSAKGTFFFDTQPISDFSENVKALTRVPWGFK